MRAFGNDPQRVADMSVELAGLPTVAINQAVAKLTPAKMSLNKFDLKIGKNDIQASGALNNLSNDKSLGKIFLPRLIFI